MRALSSFLLPVPLVLVLAACGSTAPDLGDSEDSGTVTIVPSLSSIDGGATIRLTLTARKADGTVLHPLGAVWRSSDLAVATVAQGGLVTGGSPGLAAITARWQGVSGTAVVKVLPTIKSKDSGPSCLVAGGIPTKGSGDDCRR